MSENKKPVFSIKVGLVSGAVWETPAKEEGQRPMYNITINRSYKDKEGEWQQTNSLGLSNVKDAEVALNQCYQYCKIREE